MSKIKECFAFYKIFDCATLIVILVKEGDYLEVSTCAILLVANNALSESVVAKTKGE